VAGWQWYQSIAEVRAVRMVLNRVWQWQYWPIYGYFYIKISVKKWLGGSGSVARGVAVAGWQWWQSIAEVRAVRMVLNRVWQWQYWPIYGYFYIKISVKKWLGGSGSVARGVAVAGWQWWQSIAEIRAVRMVQNRVWQWQYWQRYDQYLQYAQKKCQKLMQNALKNTYIPKFT
jgi:hypothetical protein